jgi:hypothetical protein
MSHDLLRLIERVRAFLDSLESELKQKGKLTPDRDFLATIRYMTARRQQLDDWMDRHGFPSNEAVRHGLDRVDELMDDGFSLEEIKKHRRMKRLKLVVPYIDEFFAKRSATSQERQGR